MGEAKWTKDQEQAIKTRHCNLLVAAAAGSGKTAVLVERIIRIITDDSNPVDIDRLLVVTFTNAAAAEMRERIGEAIAKALDKNPDSKVLQRQLTLLNKASITTMHSFCLNVIKNNFHRIDLDPSFRIADSTEETLLKNETLQELFEERYAESEEASDSDFLRLVESYGGGRDDLKLQELVLSLYDFVISGPWPKKWLAEMAEEFNAGEEFQFGTSKWGSVLKESIKTDIFGAKGLIKKCVEMVENASGLESYLEVFKADEISINNLYSLCDASWEELYKGFSEVEFKTLRAPSKKVEYDKELAEKAKAFRTDRVKEVINKIKKDSFRFKPEEIGKQLRELYPSMKCLSELVLQFDERYRLKKRERGLLDFSDLEHLALAILTTEEENGEIVPSETAVAFRGKFDEVLVDEYQDSNNVQEVIINMVSRKLTDQPNVFMVGDIKQSIYRFRQAEPGLFLNKYENYSREEGSANRVITLYKNFRSREEVISGVNYIFKTVMSKTVGELEYTDEEALNLGAEFKKAEDGDSITGGPVELHLIEKVESTEDQFDEGENEEEDQEESQEEELDNIQLEARVVAKRIKELMSEIEGKRFKVFDKKTEKYRPVQFRDIVILLRATKDYAPIFVEELGIEGIPVYADTGSGYFDTIEIRTMMSLLQIIDNPLQDIPLIAVLRSPVFSFTAEELIDIRLVDKTIPFYQALKIYKEANIEKSEEAPYKKVLEFLQSLERWRNKALHMPIDELIWYLYTSTGYYGYAGAMPGGVQRQANLRILFERARQFEQTSYRGLFNFVNFIDRLRTSSGDMGSAKILGENEDVIRIMSIHKSKGLEFPVVFLSGGGKNFNLMDINKSLLFHQELGLGPDYVDPDRRISYPSIVKLALRRKIKLETLSEEMRILYVALTRAKEKLIITGTAKKLKATCEKWWSNTEKDSSKIPEYASLRAKSYLDWIVPSVAKHVDGAVIRDYAEVEDYETGVLTNDGSQWEIKIWNKWDIIKNSYMEPEEDIEEEKVSCDYLEKLVDNKPTSPYKKEIHRRLSWQYKFMEAAKIPAKYSVTELKRLGNEMFTDSYTTNMITPKLEKKPRFLEEQKGLSPTERGTAMHFVMQHLDLRMVSDYNAVTDQIKNMVKKELITEEQAMSVSIKRIMRFFNSPLGSRMLSVKDFDRDLRREIPFYMKLKSTEIYKDLPEEIYGEEVSLLQGVIDCYFREDDGLVLLDYKTDYATEENMAEIKDRYEKQIYYYTEALQRITGEVVKEKYIYLFSDGETIKYE